MKIKTVLFLMPALFFLVLQGCMSGSMQDNSYQDNTTQNNPDQNNTYQNNSDQDNQAYNIDDLNQYGDWENYNSYGRVWRPSVAAGWQPFTNGHWSYDGNDWVWISYEPFGWMVYHYGSWENSPEYGWVWIPEEDAWSPATVDWMYYDDQVSWAPRRAHNKNWGDPWNQDNNHAWVSVRMEDFNRENVSSYRMNKVPIVQNNQPQTIQRRQPDIKIVQVRVKDPIQTVRIEREPVQRNPVRTNATPNVINNQTRTDVPPKVDSRPNEITPPVLHNEKDPLSPRDRNPNAQTPVNKTPDAVKPPIDRNPTVVPPPVIRNQNTQPVRNPAPNVGNQNNRQLYKMQLPPQEKQRVNKYQPAVEKNVLRKKAPDNKGNQPNKPDQNTQKRKDNKEK